MNRELQEWLNEPEAGWTRAELAFLSLAESFVSGDHSGRLINVRYYQDQEATCLLGKVVFGPGTQGPPDHAHGGSIAALLDDAMGGAAWLAGYPVVAAKLEISFRNMLPLGTPCLVKTQVVKAEGRKVTCTGHIMSLDAGTLFSSGEAMYVILSDDQIRELSPRARSVIEKMNRDLNS